MQTPAPWSLIGRSMTAPQALLSPSIILPSLSPHCTFLPARKNSPCVKKGPFNFFFLFKTLIALQINLNIRQSVSVCTELLEFKNIF
jgi:hypothetical protein